nr:hypothetical protein CFP56_04925 [Quercus suber]
MCAIVILSRNRRVGRIGGWGDQILDRANVRVVNTNQMVWMDDTTSINNVQMDRRAFRKFCDMLHIHGVLRSSKNMEMDEMVVSFLHVLAHHAKNRVVARQLAQSGHPNAKGLRNKRFPHFDDLALVFGKDRASWDGAQHATDATEELARGQENQAPTNEAKIEKNAGIEEINGNGYGYGSQTQISNQGASSKNLNKKRPRSNDELTKTSMEIMKDFGKKYEETNGHMATIASCFKIEPEEVERRMKVFNELLKIEGLSIS